VDGSDSWLWLIGTLSCAAHVAIEMDRATDASAVDANAPTLLIVRAEPDLHPAVLGVKGY
jgi:hypothetical protein